MQQHVVELSRSRCAILFLWSVASARITPVTPWCKKPPFFGNVFPAILWRMLPCRQYSIARHQRRLRVHVAAAHLQNVVVAWKTLVEVQLRLAVEDLKYILDATVCVLPAMVTSSTPQLGTFA